MTELFAHRGIRALVWLSRVLLAFAFVVGGARKLVGQSFTRLPVTDPIGKFFADLEHMGGLSVMGGFFQVVSGVLIVVPALWCIGELIYLPILTVIVTVTWTLPFGNTRVITLLMFCALMLTMASDLPTLRKLVR